MLEQSELNNFKPTHRHKKTGGEYQFIANEHVLETLKAYDFYRVDGLDVSIMVTDDIPAGSIGVFYMNSKFEYYIRPSKMFYDGRFEDYDLR
jgi:hypothetical protein